MKWVNGMQGKVKFKKWSWGLLIVGMEIIWICDHTDVMMMYCKLETNCVKHSPL